jgi:DNA-binding response OmpR family regulator
MRGIDMNEILIIEDEIMTAKTVKEALELNEMKVEIAEDGIKGLDLIKKNNYDLILLDLKMPKLSGEDILKEIRKTRPYVFVIIYTNFSEFADIKALTNIGIDGYVNKGPDADLKELVNIIKEKLEPFSTEDLENIVEAAQIQEEE